MEDLPFFIFAIFIAFFAFKFFRHGGFKGAMFGSRITQTVGQVDGVGKNLMNNSLKIHKLDNKTIGIEIVSKSILSYQMTPVTLTKKDAKKLSEILMSVTQE